MTEDKNHGTWIQNLTDEQRKLILDYLQAREIEKEQTVARGRLLDNMRTMVGTWHAAASTILSKLSQTAIELEDLEVITDQIIRSEETLKTLKESVIKLDGYKTKLEETQQKTAKALTAAEAIPAPPKP